MPVTPQEKSCYVAVNPAQEEKLELDRNSDQSNYVLPDGQQVKVSAPLYCRLLFPTLPLLCPQIGASRFRAPEVLFNPELIGEEYEGSGWHR
jgi:centractin